MKLAVVLVSDQTVPNVVYLKNLKEYGDGFDKVLFVSSKRMEKDNKSQIIAKAVGVEYYDIIKVNENMLFDVAEQLSNYFNSKNIDEVFVNITGGTKIMSMAADNFFENMEFTKHIVYLPIGSVDYKQIYPLGKDKKAVDIPIKYRMNVEGYLNALGIGIEKEEGSDCDQRVYELFEQYFDKNGVFEKLTDILRVFRDSRKYKKLVNSDQFKRVCELLKGLNQDANDFDFKSSRKWIDFFSGGWFEEYVYCQIKQIECIDDIKLNVKLDRKAEDPSVNNELDVVFVKGNDLYVVECKSGDIEGGLNDVLYKSAALNRGFGLSAKSYLASLGKKLLDKDGQLKSDIKVKGDIFGVKVITRNEFKSGIIDYFKDKINCK